MTIIRISQANTSEPVTASQFAAVIGVVTAWTRDEDGWSAPISVHQDMQRISVLGAYDQTLAPEQVELGVAHLLGLEEPEVDVAIWASEA